MQFVQPALRARRFGRFSLTCALACLVATAASAQTVNPRLVEFTPSSDHNTTLSTGQAAVSRYDLQVFTVGASAPFHTVNMGKPGPQADGLIHYDFSSGVSAWPLPGGTYEARVAAVGPGGAGQSSASNSFTFQASTPPPPDCAYTVTPPSASFLAGGGNGSFTLTTSAGCAWTAASSASWVTVGTPSGTASGTVSYTVAANTGTTSRTATITAGGQTFAVSQAAASCGYTISPTSQSVASGGGSGSIAVSTTSGCSWGASTQASWILLGTTSGAGNGNVPFTVAANNTTSQRSATITAAGRSFTVTQAAASCSYSMSPTSQAFDAAGGGGSFAVSTASGCNWSASPSAPWIGLGSADGTGSGSVTFTVAANDTTSPRSATISAGGSVFTVSQAAAACTYTVAPTSQNVGAGGGSGAVSVSTQAGCGWSAGSNASWLRVTSGATGKGNGQVSFAADPNNSASARSAALAVSGQTVAVSQEGIGCSYTVTPGSATVPPTGGSGQMVLNAGNSCSWNVVSSQGWLTASPTSGSGPATITYTVTKNNSTSSKSATLTVATATFTVTVSSGKTPGKPRNVTISVGQ